MGFYPVFLEMNGRPCLVVGGGEVAERKVKGLLAAGAAVTVLSPRLTPELAALRGDGRISHIEREYRDGDLEGFEVCMVATDDRAVNAQVAGEGRRRGVWINASDDPANCDFILPSVIRRGDVVIAASTGGASPALARRLREELEAYLSEDSALLAELLADVRRELRARRIVVGSETWQRAIDGRLRALLAQGRYDQAKARLSASLGVELAATEAVEQEA
jgi:precorrin-2 dehydrogenase/sirohydrochlorin ferrochelatase